MTRNRIAALLIALLIPFLANAGDINQDLIEAAKRGDAAAVEALLAEGADVNAKGEHEQTPLIYAASEGHPAVVEALLAGGADVNAKTRFGWTALMYAASNGHLAAVEALLVAGADVKINDAAPSMLAAMGGHPAVVQLLEEAGARNDESPVPLQAYAELIKAAKEGDAAAVEALLAGGADPNWNVWGQTALMSAAFEGQTAAVEALLAAGADVNAKHEMSGWTALTHAASRGHTAVVEALLAGSADVNAKTRIGRTALMHAARRGHTDVVRLLEAAGADVRTTLMHAAREGHTDTVRALLEAGADPNAKNVLGWTALMVAAAEGHTDTVRALLDAGTEVGAKNRDGITAWTLAAAGDHTDVVQLLEKAGAEKQEASVVERVRWALNERSAIDSLRAVNIACYTYSNIYPEQGYPSTLAVLGPDRADRLDAVLASGTKKGYTFEYVASDTDGDGILDAYQVSASPVEPGNTGARYFFTDESMLIRVSPEGPATAESPPFLPPASWR